MAYVWAGLSEDDKQPFPIYGWLNVWWQDEQLVVKQSEPSVCAPLISSVSTSSRSVRFFVVRTKPNVVLQRRAPCESWPAPRRPSTRPKASTCGRVRAFAACRNRSFEAGHRQVRPAYPGI